MSAHDYAAWLDSRLSAESKMDSELMVLEISSEVGGNGNCEVRTTAGIDVLSMDVAPLAEPVRIDVRLHDDVALRNTSIADLLGFLEPLDVGGGKGVTIGEDGFKSVVIRLSVPG